MSDFKIKVGDKEYPLPDLDFDHWMKVVKALEKRNEKEADNLYTSGGIEGVIQFYYDLLNPYYPEVTKKVLGKMPPYQGGIEFMGLLALEFQKIPLDSKPDEEKDTPSESS
jgi:hypothetical protein